MIQQYSWADLPPPGDRGYKLKILRAKRGEWIDVGTLSDRPVGCYLHWTGTRNVGCRMPDCTFCRDGKGRKWRCYLACMESGVPYPRLVEITADALEHFYRMHPEFKEASFRGWVLRIGWNAGRRQNRPGLSLVQRPRHDPAGLPPAPDVQAELHRIWTSPPGAKEQG